MTAAAIIGAVVALSGVVVTGILAHYREKGNRENAVKLKELEIEGQRQQKRFDERKEAYAELVAVTSTISKDKYVIDDLALAFAKVKMVSDSTLTTSIAEALVLAAQRARKKANEVREEGRDPSKDEWTRLFVDEHREAHSAFIAAVRTELYGAPFDKIYGRWVPEKEVGAPLEE